MNNKSRYFRVSGTVSIDIDDVLAFLDLDDEDYVPTD